MPDIHPSLLIVQEAELDAEVLLSFVPLERQRRFGTLAECPKCHGRLRLIQSITEPTAATAILDRLGLSHETLLVARARDPTDDEARGDGDS